MRNPKVFLSASLILFMFLTITTNGDVSAKQQAVASAHNEEFILIAHRGASGFLPEHTKEALVLSFMQGANYIEQDLVATKDRQLVVLHDIYLESVTDVETKFAARKRPDGRYYVIDFTLEELRSLTVHERHNAQQQALFPSRYSGSAHFTVATFDEHVELIAQLNQAFGKDVGLYPEIKAPSWHLDQGIDITRLVVDELRRMNLDRGDANIYLQSFHPDSLKRLQNEFKVKPKLVQLIASKNWSGSSIDYISMQTPEGLRQVSQYADGVGVSLQQIVDIESGEKTDFAATANAHGLVVHAYTFRSDTLPHTIHSETAFTVLRHSGIQGLFTDQIMPYMFK